MYIDLIHDDLNLGLDKQFEKYEDHLIQTLQPQFLLDKNAEQYSLVHYNAPNSYLNAEFNNKYDIQKELKKLLLLKTCNLTSL